MYTRKCPDLFSDMQRGELLLVSNIGPNFSSAYFLNSTPGLTQLDQNFLKLNHIKIFMSFKHVQKCHIISMKDLNLMFYNSGMSSFLCIKTALLEPQLVELNMNLHTATATLLTHFATSKDSIQFSPVTFPLHADVPMKLTTIPEFVIEDLVDFLVFIRRFNDDRFEVSVEFIHILMINH